MAKITENKIFISCPIPHWGDIEFDKVDMSRIPADLQPLVVKLSKREATDADVQELANNKSVREYLLNQPYISEKIFDRHLAQIGEAFANSQSPTNLSPHNVVQINTSTSSLRSYNNPVSNGGKEAVTDKYHYTPEQLTKINTVLAANSAKVTKVSISTDAHERDLPILTKAFTVLPALVKAEVNGQPIAELAPQTGRKIEQNNGIIETVANKILSGETVLASDYDASRGIDTLRLAIADRMVEKVLARDEKIGRQVDVSHVYAEVAGAMKKSELFSSHSIPLQDRAASGISGLTSMFTSAVKNAMSHGNEPVSKDEKAKPRGLAKGSSATEVAVGIVNGIRNAIAGIVKTFAPNFYAQQTQQAATGKGA